MNNDNYVMGLYICVDFLRGAWLPTTIQSLSHSARMLFVSFAFFVGSLTLSVLYKTKESDLVVLNRMI